MEQKNDRCEELVKDLTEEKQREYDMLSEEVTQLDTIIENFKKVREEVRKSVFVLKKFTIED